MAGMSLVKPDVLTDNMVSINSLIKQSYEHAKKHLQEGVSVFKEEFIDIYDKAGYYLNKIALPVNNFLKDITQIDAELQQEIYKQSLQPNNLVVPGPLVSVEKALSGFMEENY